jgi:chlorosome envelope protein B
MSNDSVQDFSVALNNMVQTVGTLAQQSFELLNIGIKTAGQIIEPLVKATCDLTCKASTTATQVNPVTPVFQGSSVSTPRK